MPGVRCTRSLACEINRAHEHSHYRFTGVTPAFPDLVENDPKATFEKSRHD